MRCTLRILHVRACALHAQSGPRALQLALAGTRAGARLLILTPPPPRLLPRFPCPLQRRSARCHLGCPEGGGVGGGRCNRWDTAGQTETMPAKLQQQTASQMHALSADTGGAAGRPHLRLALVGPGMCVLPSPHALACGGSDGRQASCAPVQTCSTRKQCSALVQPHSLQVRPYPASRQLQEQASSAWCGSLEGSLATLGTEHGSPWYGWGEVCDTSSSTPPVPSKYFSSCGGIIGNGFQPTAHQLHYTSRETEGRVIERVQPAPSTHFSSCGIEAGERSICNQKAT